MQWTLDLKQERLKTQELFILLGKQMGKNEYGAKMPLCKDVYD